MSERIDAHQHFWNYSPSEYGWIDDSLLTLKRDFLPAELAIHLDNHSLDGSVAVQARQTVNETRWLLELAENNPRIFGVIGWLDLQSSSLTADLDSLSASPALKGLRHVIQDEPDNNFILRPAFVKGVTSLAGYGLTYDILIVSQQLPATVSFVRNFDSQPFVIDHIAKPCIKDGEFEFWKQHMAELARYERVYCKLSGMVTEAAWHSWKPEDIIPYMETVITLFGPDRVMFGSDWPVCTVAGSYDDIIALVENYIAALSLDEQAQIMGRTAATFYSLTPRNQLNESNNNTRTRHC